MQDDSIFEEFRQRLSGGPIKVISAPQLFPTPEWLAEKMVDYAEIEPGHRVLEPSAGTGVLLRAIGSGPDKVAVEINPALAQALTSCGVSGLSIICGDFMEEAPNLGLFDRVVMNPPFKGAQDVKHILKAAELLKEGGVLVALCADGPRQKAKLEPLADYWEPLPAGTFKEAGTNVNTVLMVIRK